MTATGQRQEEARCLRSGFLRSVVEHPDRPALAMESKSISYGDLYIEAAKIAATLHRAMLPQGRDGRPRDRLTAVLGHRSFAAFASVLGILFYGDGYVPLNPMFPIDRSRAMLERAGTRVLLCEAQSTQLLAELLSGLGGSYLIIVPDAQDVTELSASLPGHRVLGAGNLAPAGDYQPEPVDPNGIAYLLFTSGSTGKPKGVMVAHRNVVPFVDAMVERYQITEQDRFSQTFDLTFDLSVFDMFVAWERGACLCVPTQSQKLFPGKYVKQHALTVWFSVPSTAVMMKRLRMLRPEQYPELRWSLFCGEALPAELALSFQAAAPNSIVENLYGPTELTIACTLYRFEGEASLPACEHGVVPIGEPYPNMSVLVVDEQLSEVAEGATGELLMTGPQLTLGYWHDPERTSAAFVQPPGKDRIYYRTGDRVRRPSSGEALVYLGRVDNQIKVQGYRVELGEIEAVLRDAAGVDVAIAVGFPQSASGADGIVGFISNAEADLTEVRDAARRKLPPYMHPSEVRHVAEFPLNANGKVDRHALLASLSE